MRRKGLALLIVVGVLGILAMLAMAFLTMAQLERRASAQRLYATKALLLARSGVEDALARIATGLVELGVGQLIVAGGETSGAVVKALGVRGLRIGPEIDPGVPWTVALHDAPGTRPLALALKSGNFGTPDFFLKAWDKLA